MAGYSGTPLWKKLGLKPGLRVAVIGAPDDYLSLLGEDAPEVEWHAAPEPGDDLVHIFETRRSALERQLSALRDSIDRAGMIWVSWPKKSSRVPSEITEDTIREVALPIGLVDVKVCAVSDVWSGLKLVIRKELR